MIRFACTCGHGFEVADDEAGGALQCTRCGRLNDIPNHSDLLSLAADGTYSLDAGEPVAVDPHRMADVHLVYAKTKHDEHGNAIDLRSLPAGPRVPRGGAGHVHAGDDAEEFGELDLKPPPEEPVKVRPRYDPETGELIRDIPLARDPERPVDPSTIPMAKAAINYASGQLARRISPSRILLELCMPLNLAVMFFMLLAHGFNAVLFVASVGLIFLWPVLLLWQAMMLAHYANVIDETGRNERDELPRPMRDFGFYDDLWLPFVQMAFALMLAYLPPLAVAAYLPGPQGVWQLGALGIGTVLAPALILTTTTSGGLENLRPDRVLGLMRVAGLHYVVAVLLWAVTWPVYFVLGWVGICFWFTDVMGIAGGDLGAMGELRVVLPCLLVGLYLMHCFSWYMGMVYRAHHDVFPWVLQRHVRDPARAGRTHADQLGRRQRRVGRADPVVQQGPVRVAPTNPPAGGAAGPQTGRPAPVGPQPRIPAPPRPGTP